MIPPGGEATPAAADVRLILASASSARLATLRHAGLHPVAIVSGVDEDNVDAATPADLAAELARRKAETVVERLPERDPASQATTIVVGCDSVLDLDNTAYGKPGSVAVAVERWRLMRGRSGVLHTGHHVVVLDADGRRFRTGRAATTVHFAELDDDEIDAYVATGEPLQVAGGFTIDGRGGPFVSRLEGDPSNVVGVSLPLLRAMLADLGVRWPRLWQAPSA